MTVHFGERGLHLKMTRKRFVEKTKGKDHSRTTQSMHLLLAAQETEEESKLRHTEGPSPNQLTINELPQELLQGPDVVYLDA